jgi:hypothetical protein
MTFSQFLKRATNLQVSFDSLSLGDSAPKHCWQSVITCELEVRNSFIKKRVAVKFNDFLSSEFNTQAYIVALIVIFQWL